jgi:hypothetical protein
MILLRNPPPLDDRLTKEMYLYSSAFVPSCWADCELFTPLKINLQSWQLKLEASRSLTRL